jgi:WhiB family transcriptional regulator, redox-sensing transcriptional regulator
VTFLPRVPRVEAAEELERGWQSRTACRNADTALFFPDRGENATLAKAVCRACPVKAACLEYALLAGEKYGVWGMTSESERLRLRNKRRSA